MKLSVILPGIRRDNWLRLYQSIQHAFSDTFELVIISPYDLPDDFKKFSNIKIIKDLGTPVRCMGIGLEACQGEYITWAADDGIFLNKSLDIAVKSLEGKENAVVVGKYNEGQPNPVMNNIDYYYINKHDASKCKFIADDCLMVMEGVIPAKLLREIGGWDAQFEVCPMAFLDLSVRLYRHGAEFIFQQESMFSCSHMPNHEGDHGPVHDGQTLHDEKLFRELYKTTLGKDRKIIPIDTWKKSPERWERRFGCSPRAWG